MKIIVNDTNIFIDLHSIGLLKTMCKLPFEIHTVDFVASEIVNEQQLLAFNELVAELKFMSRVFHPKRLLRLSRNMQACQGIYRFLTVRCAIMRGSTTCLC